MATDRQIAANRLNSARSTGPKSEAGKAASRANATRHGMAGASAMVGPGLSGAFLERRARWGAEYDPAGEAGHWALDRAVAASLRIEQCERVLEEHVEATRRRASLAWDQDRAVEAAQVAGRLARDPVLASRQLETTVAGVELLIDAWFGLLQALGRPGGWSDPDASRALDLLGVHPESRAGRTAIDGPEGADPAEFRKALALDEVDRLEGLLDGLSQLDEMDRRRAMVGDSALLSKPASLLLRYERDAWRRYRESIREVQDGAIEPGPEPTRTAPRPDLTPAPIAAPPPSPIAAPPPAGRWAKPEEAARALAGFGGPSIAIHPKDDAADRRLDDLERWLDGVESAPPVPIAAGLRVPA